MENVTGPAKPGISAQITHVRKKYILHMFSKKVLLLVPVHDKQLL